MSFEIERKFLVCGDEWRCFTTSRTHIRQAYLTSGGKASVRVRIKREGGATLTIKSREARVHRLELEYPVPTLDAEALMQLCQGVVIEKTRHVVPWGNLAWEIDVFSGENNGLIIAEIELKHQHEPIDVPTWIGAEVTGQGQYYNSSLARHPYCSWRRGRRGIRGR